jgi:DNA repair ATPase RecN
MDTNGKNKAYSCSNTDRRCYERLQFFNNMLTKLRKLKDDVKADISELKRNPEMISECVGRLSTLSFILELFGEKVVEISNYQSN